MENVDRFVRFTFVDGEPTPCFDGGSCNADMVKGVEGYAAAGQPVASPRQQCLQQHLGRVDGESMDVARMSISELSPEIFERRFRAPGVPLIIRGALDGEMAHNWVLRAFVDLFEPEDTFHCRVHGGDEYASTPDMWRSKSHARHVVRTTARKFGDTIASGVARREDCYVQADVRNTRAGRVMAPQLAAIGARCGLELHPLYSEIVNMWWGPSGHTEPLHMDVTDGTLCQLRGRKRVVLFPPECWRDLYPFPADEAGMSWAFSRVVQSRPDLDRFPRLASALRRRIEVVLDEGEVLFIPACCAHEISGEATLSDGSQAEHVLSINRFWRTHPDLVRKHLPAGALHSFDATLAVDGRGGLQMANARI
jgi:hypothetical protein